MSLRLPARKFRWRILRGQRLGGIVTIIGLALAVAACGSEPAPETGNMQGSNGAKTMDPTKMPVIMDLDQQVDSARDDLADRLGVAADDLRLLEAKAVRWSDSSLGCPLPDRAYTQVVTPGVLVRLAHGKTVYEYHAGTGGTPFLCEPPGVIKPPILAPPGSFDDGT
jgi:hypothetical protein